MIAVLPFHLGEVGRLKELLAWCRELGSCPNHSAVLIADAAVDWVPSLELLTEAQTIFQTASMVATPAPFAGGWPAASNKMFLFAAAYMQDEGRQPWLWLEADAVPLKPGWLDTLNNAYKGCGKPFMGAVVTAMRNGLPFTYMNGVAVYPPDAYSHMEKLCRAVDTKAFDVASADHVLPMAAPTNLIHCHWGLKGKPPVFSTAPDPTRENVVQLSFIQPEAVLFHRNKDGSLIRLLRRQRLPGLGTLLTVVLPFCNKDAEQMLRNLWWMAELHGKTNYPAALVYPSDVSAPFKEGVVKAANAVFAPVTKLPYRGRSTQNWPDGANCAFQAAAWSMEGRGPWLWLEPDAIPVKPDWLDVLWTEYNLRGKPFFGPIVPDRGHMNGVAIYPADTAKRCPATMTTPSVAFDYVMKAEMIDDCYDASKLIQHCWGIVGGAPHPSGGEPACFFSQAELDNWLDKDAVLFHRCKDGSLISRLKERKNESRSSHSLLPG